METLKKVKDNWSHALKCVTTTTKMKVTKVRAKPKIIRTADANVSAMLNSAFYLNHVMRSGPVATSYQEKTSFNVIIAPV